MTTKNKNKKRLLWSGAIVTTLALTANLSYNYFSGSINERVDLEMPIAEFTQGEHSIVSPQTNKPALDTELENKTDLALAIKNKDESIINSEKEFKIGEKVAIKGKVIDFYEAPSAKSVRSRVTVIKTQDMKYGKVRIEETYKLNDHSEEQVLSMNAMVADHVIVKLDDQISEEALENISVAHGFKIRKKMYSPGMYLVETPTAKAHSVPSAISTLSTEKGVRVTDPDYLVTHFGAPSDSSFNELWGMHNTGQTNGRSDADIDALEAWDTFTGSRDVVVGVIDTGINYNHPDLAANIWINTGEIPDNGIDDDGNGLIDDVHGYDFYNDDGDPDDDHSHGSHCAGTIGGIGNNGEGVAGVNWQVSMMGLKFLDSYGSGYISDAIECVTYATANGAHMTSNSWGGGSFSQAMKDALEDANTNDVLFVAAAGNSSSNNDVYDNYPSNYDVDNVIAVAATNHKDRLAKSFSNYGHRTVDLGAPGVSIYSTVLGEDYDSYRGTSMATPHVAGVCALLKGFDPTLTANDIKLLTIYSGDTKKSLVGKTLTGKRLNANNALKMVNDTIFIVNSPIDGKNYLQGWPVEIKWSSYNLEGDIRIKLFKDGVFQQTLAKRTENDGIFEWTIPDDFQLGNYQINVIPLSDKRKRKKINISVVEENFPSNLDGWNQSWGSDSSWTIATDQASQGVFSLKSNDIGDGQVAAIEYFGNFEAGHVTFDKKVSSEENYDFLVFYIDGVEQARWSGDIEWSNETYAVSAGLHSFKWEFQKDFIVSGGADCAWIDEVNLPTLNSKPAITIVSPVNGEKLVSSTSVDIAWNSYQLEDPLSIDLVQNGEFIQAIGTTNDDGVFNWNIPSLPLGDYQLQISSRNLTPAPRIYDEISITIGLESFPTSLEGWNQTQNSDAGWSPSSLSASEGVYSLKSGDIGMWQIAGTEYTGTFQAGEISFDKKVSCEYGTCFLVFYIDDELVGIWTGEDDWSTETFTVSSGNHTFYWEYMKYGGAAGLDSAFIDAVSFPIQEE